MNWSRCLWPFMIYACIISPPGLISGDVSRLSDSHGVTAALQEGQQGGKLGRKKCEALISERI